MLIVKNDIYLKHLTCNLLRRDGLNKNVIYHLCLNKNGPIPSLFYKSPFKRLSLKRVTF